MQIGEFTAAFGIAYDWFYDAWTADQKTAIMWSILELGLQYGVTAYADPYGAGENYSWWTLVNGNWNCVCSRSVAFGSQSKLMYFFC